MPLVKVNDLAYVRFQAPDLDRMEDFLKTFGMARAERTDNALYMRGTGPDFAVHITELGEAGFAALAFEANDQSDLEKFARAHDKMVEARTEPGGGYVVRIDDPSGHKIELVHGIATHEQLPTLADQIVNTGCEKRRTNATVRIDAGASHVRRLGHCVLNVVDYRASQTWYHENFGLLISDEIYIEAEENVLGAFLRCDCGDRPVDHHTVFLVGSGAKGFNHAAWEVENIDDLMLGHQALKETGAKNVWGVGRHILGSQVFDYWQDPWGHKVEHWTDGDLFCADEPPGLRSFEVLLGSQWGGSSPPEMAD